MQKFFSKRLSSFLRINFNEDTKRKLKLHLNAKIAQTIKWTRQFSVIDQNYAICGRDAERNTAKEFAGWKKLSLENLF